MSHLPLIPPDVSGWRIIVKKQIFSRHSNPLPPPHPVHLPRRPSDEGNLNFLFSFIPCEGSISTLFFFRSSLGNIKVLLGATKSVQRPAMGQTQRNMTHRVIVLNQQPEHFCIQLPRNLITCVENRIFAKAQQRAIVTAELRMRQAVWSPRPVYRRNSCKIIWKLGRILKSLRVSTTADC